MQHRNITQNKNKSDAHNLKIQPFFLIRKHTWMCIQHTSNTFLTSTHLLLNNIFQCSRCVFHKCWWSKTCISTAWKIHSAPAFNFGFKEVDARFSYFVGTHRKGILKHSIYKSNPEQTGIWKAHKMLPVNVSRPKS